MIVHDKIEIFEHYFKRSWLLEDPKLSLLEKILN